MKTRATKVLKEMGYKVVDSYTDDGKFFIFLAVDEFHIPFEIAYNSEINFTTVTMLSTLTSHEPVNVTDSFIAYYNKLFA